MDSIGFMLLIFGPALIGLTALVVGIVMLQKPKDAEVNSTARAVIGAICLLIALGVGACYGIMLLGRF
jgi:hypothetical protein